MLHSPAANRLRRYADGIDFKGRTAIVNGSACMLWSWGESLTVAKTAVKSLAWGGGRWQWTALRRN
jgi:hypothetical protein